MLNASLSTKEWISHTNRELILKGVNPEDRIHYTGHPMHLPTAYVSSIGWWCRLHREEMIDTQRPALGLVKVRYGAFRQFRSVRQLMLRNEFEIAVGCLDDQPWLLAERAWCAIDEAQNTFRASSTTPASLGVAAQLVVENTHRDPERNLGILPVEVVLWARLFNTLLSQHRLKYAGWQEATHERRTKLWALGAGSARQPWDIDDFLHARARRALSASALDAPPAARGADVPGALGASPARHTNAAADRLLGSRKPSRAAP